MLLILFTRLSDGKCVMAVREPLKPKPALKSEAVAENPGDKKERGELVPVPFDSPLWRGGGVIFGPQPRDYEIKMNRKERRLALRTAFQSRCEDLIIVENFAENLPRPKTKELLSALSRWGVESNAKVLLILAEPAENISLSARNVPSLKMIRATSLNVYDVLEADKIVTTAEAIGKIQEVYSD